MGGGMTKKLQEEQLKSLKEEKKRADEQARADAAKTAAQQDAIKRGLLGRSSLIKTSELGVSDKLGVG